MKAFKFYREELLSSRSIKEAVTVLKRSAELCNIINSTKLEDPQLLLKLTPVHKTFMGVQVKVNTEAAFLLSGAHPNEVGACINLCNGNYTIVVNTKFLELSNEHQGAILAHEVGHKELQHFFRKERDYMVLEYEADAFAARCGWDIHGALAHMQSSVLFRSNQELALRLQALA